MIRGEFDEALERIWSTKTAYFIPEPDTAAGARFLPPTKVHARDSYFRATFYELWAEDGSLVFRSDTFRGLPNDDVFGPPNLELIQSDRGSLVTTEIEHSGTFRVKSSPLRIGERTYLFRAARESSEIGQRVRGLIQTCVYLLFAFCVIAFFAADWLIRRNFAPVEAVRRHAEQISARRLHERLPVENPHDEIGQLSQTLNHLLDRLEGSFEEMKAFTSDASYELRTPLAAIRALGESTLQRSGVSAEELRETMQDILEEAQRLTGLTDRLLAMARLDSLSGGSIAKETFDLSAQTRRIVEQLEVLATDKNQQIDVELPSELEARGDSMLVHQALANLVENAIKYTPKNGKIRIAGTSRGDSVSISVTDSGPGIAAEHQSLVFRRFYRVDSDRGRGTGGYGIGLAIARKAVELSEGSLALESEPGRGSRFTVTLRSGISLPESRKVTTGGF
jgi:signal transduction histidine kinase